MLHALVLAFQLSAISTTQTSPASGPANPSAGVAGARSARATRTLKPPVIDGRDDDAIWRDAESITAFRQFDPVEDGEPPLPTEAKVAYDEHYNNLPAMMVDRQLRMNANTTRHARMTMQKRKGRSMIRLYPMAQERRERRIEHLGVPEVRPVAGQRNADQLGSDAADTQHVRSAFAALRPT